MFNTLTIPQLHGFLPVGMKYGDGRRNFTNYDTGMHVMKQFFQNSVQLVLGQHIWITAMDSRISEYSQYEDNGRGGGGFFVMNIVATFTTPSGEFHSVLAELCIICEEPEHYWRPGFTGSYLCIDGTEFSCILSDMYSGNISRAKEGFGDHISNEFLKNVSQIPWIELLKTKENKIAT